MTLHRLDFSHAFAGRLPSHGKTSPDSLAAQILGEERARGLAQRLHDDVSEGLLPFIDLSFLDSLESSLPPLMAGLPPVKHLILLGVGGSSLGAKALQKAFAPGQDRPGHQGPWLWIADNIDADTLESWFSHLDAKDVVVAVISKSGSTIETMAQYFLLKEWLQKELGASWAKHVVAITDAEKGALREEAITCGLASLPVPAALGGRYSVMSAVGMLPAAFMGMDWKGFLRGVKAASQGLSGSGANSSHLKSGYELPLYSHPAFRLALWAYELTRQGYDELIFFNYIPMWSELGQWFAQLWAESLGKEGKGSMPLPAVGVSDQHSLQQMFLAGRPNKGCLFIHAPQQDKGPAFGETVLPGWEYLRGQRFGDLLQAEATGTHLAFVHKHIPVVECVMASADEEACGRLMGLLMAATLLTGWMLDINPLDQPAVEFGKRLANARLGAPGYEDEKKMLDTRLVAPKADALSGF